MVEACRSLLSLLVMLLSSDGTKGCMLCFFTAEYRLRICKHFVGFTSDLDYDCMEVFKNEFHRFDRLKVGAKDKDILKGIFKKAVHYIDQRSILDTKNYTVDIPEGISRIKSQLENLAEASPCIPPCGYQKTARVYKCESCTVADCGYPLDCELQDIFVNENARTSFQCAVKFIIPKDVTVVWKFAKDLRTRDLSYFKDLHSGDDLFILIKPTKPYHQGTYSCQIQDGEDILARNYFYVNVTAFSTAANVKLQEAFYNVVDANEDMALLSQRIHGASFHELLKKPGFLSRTSVVLIILAIALFTMLATLLIGAGYRYATDIEEE